MADAPARAATDTPHPGMSFRAFVTLMASLMAINALTIDSMLPALPQIGAALGIAEPNDRQWIITAYLLGFGVAQLIYGPLADRFGRRPVMIVGVSLFVVTSFLAAFAASFELMILARVLQGASAASTRVLAVSIIRDCYSGRTMARVMSLTMIVFLAAPVVAPTLGQVIMLFASWRWIFIVLGVVAAVILLWTVLRLPETLHPDDRMPIAVAPLVRASRLIITNRYSFGYTAAQTVLFAGLFGFINSVQQIFTDIFRIPDYFPMVFALCAGTMALGSFLNSRIVMRLGTRRVSHSAALGYLTVALLHLAIVVAGYETVWTFSILQALLMGCMALAGSNFSSMAMEPVGHVAGTASSLQGAFSTLGAALIGMVIGQSYDGTTAPLTIGYVVLGAVAITIVLFVERGRLFRPGAAPAQ